MAAARSPPAFEPAKRKFLRPRATTRNARSAALRVDLELSIVDVTGEGTPAREAVADRSRGVRLAGELRKRGFEPRVHAIEKSFCSGLTDRLPDLRRAAPYLLFDGIESGDALDRFGRSRVRDARCGSRGTYV